MAPSPAYPVYERAAAFAGREVVTLPLAEEHGFLPDLASVPDRRGARRRCSGSTTRTTRPPPPHRSRCSSTPRRSRASTTSSWPPTRPTPSLLREHAAGLRPAAARPAQRRRVQHALQAVLDAGLPVGLRRRRPRAHHPLKRYRPNVGVAPQAFVQRAAIAAWGDEAHVAAVRPPTAPSATCSCPCSRTTGCAARAATPRSSSGSTPARRPTSWRRGCSRRGIVLAPGSFFGDAGRGYLRLALVPTLAECERAAERLDALLD